MKYNHFSIISFTAFLIVATSLSGCLNNSGPKITSDISFGLRVDSFDSTLVASNDSLRIERVRFVYGDGTVVINGDTSSVLPSPDNWIQFGISQTGNNPIVMFRANPGTFHQFVLSIQKAPANNSNIDPDFTENTRHSMIIEGKYNGSEFTYKSDRAFQIPLEIDPPAEVPDYNASYAFLISTNPRLWFANSDGGFYNPSTADDSTAINDNIRDAFSIETIKNQNVF